MSVTADPPVYGHSGKAEVKEMGADSSIVGRFLEYACMHGAN